MQAIQVEKIEVADINVGTVVINVDIKEDIYDQSVDINTFLTFNANIRI